MHVERLTKLAELLEAMPEKPAPVALDLRRWAMPSYAEHQPCQTAACACGHAALDPWFQQQGLSLYRTTLGTRGFYELVEPPIRTAEQLAEACRAAEGDVEFTIHELGGERHYGAAMRFFELSWDTCQWLFEASRYFGPVTPQLVASRIRNALENGEPWPDED
jgi:hypothetical protein